MKTYLAVYLVSFLSAVSLTPFVIWFAHRLRLYDSRGIRKIHKHTIPRIGGTAIFLSTLIAVGAILFTNNDVGRAFSKTQNQVFVLLGAGAFIFLIGLIDDVRGLLAPHKLLAQVVASMILCLSGIRIISIDFAGIYALNLGWLSFPVTVLWIVAVTNAMNLIDGLDGLAAGISAIAYVAIAVFSIFGNQIVMSTITLAVLGSLCGFLIFNFNPARIFMGDCGSMFLGFVLAGSSVICSVKSGTVVALGLAILALGVPIFDMLFAMLRRYLEGRRIMSPDRSHLHHLLLDLGLRQRHIVVCMYIVTAMAAGVGLLMMLSQGAGAILIFTCAVILQILVFRLVGAVNLREAMTGLKHKYAALRQKNREVESYEQVELYFRRANTFKTWWHAVCFAAEKMDFSCVKLPLRNRDGSRRNLIWQKDNFNIGPEELVDVTVPVRDRRAGEFLKLNVEIATNNSLESAGRRTVLLTRLMERYNLSNLPVNKRKSQSLKKIASRPAVTGSS